MGLGISRLRALARRARYPFVRLRAGRAPGVPPDAVARFLALEQAGEFAQAISGWLQYDGTAGGSLHLRRLCLLLHQTHIARQRYADLTEILVPAVERPSQQDGLTQLYELAALRGARDAQATGDWARACDFWHRLGRSPAAREKALKNLKWCATRAAEEAEQEEDAAGALQSWTYALIADPASDVFAAKARYWERVLVRQSGSVGLPQDGAAQTSLAGARQASPGMASVLGEFKGLLASARSFAAMGQHRQAREIFQSLEEAGHDVASDLGELDLLAGKTDAARLRFKALLADRGRQAADRWTAWRGLAIADAVEGRSPEALATLRGIATTDPHVGAAFGNQIADVAVRIGSPNTAIAILRDLTAAFDPARDAAKAAEPEGQRGTLLLQKLMDAIAAYHGGKALLEEVRAGTIRLTNREGLQEHLMRKAVLSSSQTLVGQLQQEGWGRFPWSPALRLNVARSLAAKGRLSEAGDIVLPATSQYAREGSAPSPLMRRADALALELNIAWLDLEGACRILVAGQPDDASLGGLLVAVEGVVELLRGQPGAREKLSTLLPGFRVLIAERAVTLGISEQMRAALHDMSHADFWAGGPAQDRPGDETYAQFLYLLACAFTLLRRPLVAIGLLKAAEDLSQTLKGDIAVLRGRIAVASGEDQLDERLLASTGPNAADHASIGLVLAGRSGHAERALTRLAELKTLGAFGIAAAGEGDWRTLEAIVRALLALQDARWDEATAILRQTGAAERLAALDSRPDVSKVFLAGYGWSGSSAVYDSLKSMPAVCEMPGAGVIDSLNIGADSEPMLFCGPGALNALWAGAVNGDRLDANLLWNFFRVHVLAGHSQNYMEYKGTNAARNTRAHIDPDYTDAMAVFFMDLAGLMKQETRTRFGADTLRPFRNLIARLMKAIAVKSDANYILINNGIQAEHIETLFLVENATFISVHRNLADQFADQRRSNKVFAMRAEQFHKMVAGRRNAFFRGRNLVILNHGSARIDDLAFEDWVRDGAARAAFIKTVVGSYSAEREAQHFIPAQSARNIGIAPEYLSPEEYRLLNEPRYTEAIDLLYERADLRIGLLAGQYAAS